MQVPFASFRYQSGGTETCRTVFVRSSLPLGFHFDSPAHDGKAEHSRHGRIGVVAVPQQVNTGGRVLWSGGIVCRPLSLGVFSVPAFHARVNCLVGRDDPPYRRLGHLGQQSVFVA